MTILTGIREIIAAHLGLSPFEISRSDDFNQLGIDSLDHAKIISDCEEKWQIEIPEKEAASCISVADLLSAVLRATSIKAMVATR